MTLILSLATLLGALTVGAISPGPSFLLVARTSIAGSRREGLAAALGMGVGGVIFAILVMLGLKALLTNLSWLYAILKTACSLYLIYLAICLWRGASQPMADTNEESLAVENTRGAFFRALLTQLSNPKTLVVYGSIFAALLPPDLPRGVTITLPALVFAIEAGWYAIVALALSTATPRRTYLRCKTSLDRLAGGVMGLLGIKLLLSSVPTR